MYHETNTHSVRHVISLLYTKTFIALRKWKASIESLIDKEIIGSMCDRPVPLNFNIWDDWSRAIFSKLPYFLKPTINTKLVCAFAPNFSIPSTALCEVVAECIKKFVNFSSYIYIYSGEIYCCYDRCRKNEISIQHVTQYYPCAFIRVMFTRE